MQGQQMAFRVGSALSASLLIWSLQVTAYSRTYKVGPQEQYGGISAVAGMLEPGDVVEVTGDISDLVQLWKDGTQTNPIVIRGLVRKVAGGIVRPKVVLMTSDTVKYGIQCRGDWNVIEGLDISCDAGRFWRDRTPIYGACGNLVIRNCRVHHAYRGFDTDPALVGDTLIEYCEFDSNMDGVKFNAATPGVALTLQHCFFHDCVEGNLVKCRSPRNTIAYNWFENSYKIMLNITDIRPSQPDALREENNGLHPMHSDIVGNVFLQGWSPGFSYGLLALGGEEERAPGPEGDFTIAHNLFVFTRGTASLPSIAFLVHGNVDHVKAYNNVFVEYGVPGCRIYERDAVWENALETKAFIERRGDADPVVEGANNWVSAKTGGIPAGFANTLRALNPRFRDLLNQDYRPRKDSSLAGAGMYPLPRGQIIDLVPEYEPQRGIPAGLKPKPRRKVTPPSIGPFEVEE